MHGNRWSGERLATLRALWMAGATAQSIAEQLGGISRCAVLGKIFRLRLGAGEVAPARRRRRRKAAARLRLSAPKSAPRRGKSLFELTNDTCRWPHGRPGSARFYFCGALGADLESGMPYCAPHTRRAFRSFKSPSTVPDETVDGQSEPLAAPPPASAPKRRYVWRAAVRHPAPRWR